MPSVISPIDPHGLRRNCVNLTQFLLCGFLGSSRVLVVAVSTELSMLHTVLFSNEELLLLRREVAPYQLIFANPSLVIVPPVCSITPR